MTDLERLWDDLPVPPPPTGAILRTARDVERAARRRRWLRPAASFAAVSGLAAAFLVGVQVGGGSGPALPGGGGGDAGGSAGTQVPAFSGELVAAESCDDLLDHYVDRAVRVVGPYGWDDGDLDSWRLGFSAATTGVFRDTSSPVTQRATGSDTGTNTQEAGVDEPDVVKTDGQRLFRVRDGVLTTYDVSGDQVRPLGRLRLDLDGGELLVAGETVVVVGRHDPTGGDTADAATRVVRVDVSEPVAPAVVGTTTVDATSVGVRQHGSTVRLVLASPLPDLDFVEPGGPRGERVGWRTAERRNRELVRRTTIADWLPTITEDDAAPRRLDDCGDVAVPRDDLPLGTTAVMGLDLADPDSGWQTTTLAADTSISYASADRLYLASATSAWGGCWGRCLARVTTDWGTTHVFDFDLTEEGATYVGAAEVDGVLHDRWAMDESGGALRLMLSPGRDHRAGNHLVTLRRDGDELVEVGRLEQIGPRDDLKAVRWFDDLAVVVTFRQVDPFYTIDLSSDRQPKLIGELKIPGFSEYLHPLGPRRMVAVGRGPLARGGWGAQAALFGVHDLTRPRRLDLVDYGPGTTAGAGLEPRQFSWLPGVRTALTVVAERDSPREAGPRRTGWVSVLTVAEGRLTDRLVEAAHGPAVTDLRTVPLPDGRVVVSGDGEPSFLDLG